MASKIFGETTILIMKAVIPAYKEMGNIRMSIRALADRSRRAENHAASAGVSWSSSMLH